MESSNFRERLRMGERVYGTAVTADAPLWPGLIKKAGLDFVFLDQEHLPIEDAGLSRMCQVYSALGLTPVVRIPSNDMVRACKVLDGGAQGIVVPYLENPEQVRQFVGSVRFRPVKGVKLEKAIDDPETLEPELKRYLDTRNAGIVCLANIESVPAMENLGEMLSIPGLDGVLVGPHDLSCSLGFPEQYDNPMVEDAIREIVFKVRDRGLAAGVHFSMEPELQVIWAKAGANIILHSSDMALFSSRLTGDMNAIRIALGDELEKEDEKPVI